MELIFNGMGIASSSYLIYIISCHNFLTQYIPSRSVSIGLCNTCM